MIKPGDPRTLALDLLSRSDCMVQVAAVIADKTGLLSWGWNSSGPDGFGLHAEAHAILRANKKRLAGSKIFVASRRKKSGNLLLSKPCPDCTRLLRAAGISAAIYINDPSGTWQTLTMHN